MTYVLNILKKVFMDNKEYHLLTVRYNSESGFGPERTISIYEQTIFIDCSVIEWFNKSALNREEFSIVFEKEITETDYNSLRFKKGFTLKIK